MMPALLTRSRENYRRNNTITQKKSTVCHKQVEPGSPEPAPAHLRFLIHSLILESSELIYVKLQNVLMTPYDIETICGNAPHTGQSSATLSLFVSTLGSIRKRVTILAVPVFRSCEICSSFYPGQALGTITTGSSCETNWSCSTEALGISR